MLPSILVWHAKRGVNLFCNESAHSLPCAINRKTQSVAQSVLQSVIHYIRKVTEQLIVPPIQTSGPITLVSISLQCLFRRQPLISQINHTLFTVCSDLVPMWPWPFLFWSNNENPHSSMVARRKPQPLSYMFQCEVMGLTSWPSRPSWPVFSVMTSTLTAYLTRTQP